MSSVVKPVTDSLNVKLKVTFPLAVPDVPLVITTVGAEVSGVGAVPPPEPPPPAGGVGVGVGVGEGDSFIVLSSMTVILELTMFLMPSVTIRR